MAQRLTRAKAQEAVELLLAEYPNAGCELKYETPFQLLVAVVLSAQTTDVSVNKVTPELFAKAPDAASMAALPAAEIENCIKRIGMYRTKAANVSALSKILDEKYEGNVPESFDELTALPGVGRKTANVVLAEIYGKPCMAVDTHVFRLANKIGLTNETDVLATEAALVKLIPEDKRIAAHHALIHHGRRVCSARSPECEKCCLNVLCLRKGAPKKK